MTSTEVTRDRARARDVREAGACLLPGCPQDCPPKRPTCPPHWATVPDLLRQPIVQAWRAGDEARWLDAVDALRFYGLAIRP